MDTSSWSACACPSSGPRQTSLSRQDQWFWPCSIPSYQVCHLLLQTCFICTRQQSRWMENGVFNRVKTSLRLSRRRGAPSLTLSMRVLQESCFFCCVSLPSCIAGSTSSPSCCGSLTGCFIRCVAWLAACHYITVHEWPPRIDPP